MNLIYMDIPRLNTALAQWLACFVFILVLHRKKEWYKIFVPLICFLPLQILLLVATENISIKLWLPVMLSTFFLMYLLMFLCCEGKWKRKLYYTGFAFLLSEMTASLEWLLYYYFAYLRGNSSKVLEYTMLIVTYAAVFILVGVLEKKIQDFDSDIPITRREVVSVMIVVWLTFLFSNLSYVFPDTPFSSTAFYEGFKLRTFIDILGYIMLLIMQMHRREKVILTEANALNAALRMQYEKYMNYQENIEMMNVKYHDMKHQIMALRSESDETKKQEWLDSMESELEVYHNTIDSGNKVLDAILENKISKARKYHIEMTYVINGSLLVFFAVADLCTIFGNALDNAIEAEMLEEKREKRMIHVSVSAKRQFLHIKVENYVSGIVKFSGELPKTTKSDRKNHGYGLKSIQYTVEKYQGNMTVSQEKELFVLNIIIPIPIPYTIMDENENY